MTKLCRQKPSRFDGMDMWAEFWIYIGDVTAKVCWTYFQNVTSQPDCWNPPRFYCLLYVQQIHTVGLWKIAKPCYITHSWKVCGLTHTQWFSIQWPFDKGFSLDRTMTFLCVYSLSNWNTISRMTSFSSLENGHQSVVNRSIHKFHSERSVLAHRG